jgi:hypothetical protein
VVKALKMQPQDVDSVLVKALCACGPLTKSSNVNLQELVVRLPGVDSFNPEESHSGGLCDRDFDSQGGSRKTEASYSNWPLMKPKMLKESLNLNMATSRLVSGNGNVEKTARVTNAEGVLVAMFKFKLSFNIFGFINGQFEYEAAVLPGTTLAIEIAVAYPPVGANINLFEPRRIASSLYRD